MEDLNDKKRTAKKFSKYRNKTKPSEMPIRNKIGRTPKLKFGSQKLSNKL